MTLCELILCGLNLSGLSKAVVSVTMMIVVVTDDGRADAAQPMAVVVVLLAHNAPKADLAAMNDPSRGD